MEIIKITTDNLKGNLLEAMKRCGKDPKGQGINEVWISSVEYYNKKGLEVKRKDCKIKLSEVKCENKKPYAYFKEEFFIGFFATATLCGKIYIGEYKKGLFFEDIKFDPSGDYDFTESTLKIKQITFSFTLKSEKELKEDLESIKDSLADLKASAEEKLSGVYDYVTSMKGHENQRTGCSGDCYISCTTGCTTGCSTSCSGCTGHCSANCQGGCTSNTCAQNCQSHGCQGECDEWCGFGCTNHCGDDCDKSCNSVAWMSNTNC